MYVVAGSGTHNFPLGRDDLPGHGWFGKRHRGSNNIGDQAKADHCTPTKSGGIFA